MNNDSSEVQFVGSGSMEFSSRLEFGSLYHVKATKEEPGKMKLAIYDCLGKRLGWYPAQWFNPTYFLTIPMN